GCSFLNSSTSDSDFGASATSARRVSSFSVLAAAFRGGERAAPPPPHPPPLPPSSLFSSASLRAPSEFRPPPEQQQAEEQVSPLRQRQHQAFPPQEQQQQQEGVVASPFDGVLPLQLEAYQDMLHVQDKASSSTTSASTGIQEWLPRSHNGEAEEEGALPTSRSKRHPRLSAAANRGKFAADPYRQGAGGAGGKKRGGGAAATALPRMSTGPSSSTGSRKPTLPGATAAAAAAAGRSADVAAAAAAASLTGNGGRRSAAAAAAPLDSEDEEEAEGGVHAADDSNGNAGYQALQNALACVVASGRSAELLVWGVKCFIEKDFPCIYKPGRTLTGLEVSSDIPSKSIASVEAEAPCTCGAGLQRRANTGEVSGGKEEAAAVTCSGESLLFQQQSTMPDSGSKAGGSSSGSSSTEGGAGLCDSCSAQRSSVTAATPECCCCSNGSCLGRQVVVVSVEGHRQRDRRVLKWVRHNLLRAGDVVVLITAWERAEEPKYLRVPGMILSSSVDASTYNLTMATRLTSRVKQLGAALLADCRVYPLVVPLAVLNRYAADRVIQPRPQQIDILALILGAIRRLV
ncbi:unnamed protein product, partial [Rangifer tarandus platyrhynchus]